MHKGRLYERFPRFYVYNGEFPYTSPPPKKWKITLSTWAGTAAASVPPDPLYATAIDVDASLRCYYECPLFTQVGGHVNKLILYMYLTSNTHCILRIGGDWGPQGSLPNVSNYRFDFPWDPFSSFIIGAGTSAEAYLRPTRLVWHQDPW